jgi:hypothetical protein
MIHFIFIAIGVVNKDDLTQFNKSFLVGKKLAQKFFIRDSTSPDKKPKINKYSRILNLLTNFLYKR